MSALFGKYGTAISALIATALTYAVLYWGNGPDAKWIAAAVAVAGSLGVHVTHGSSVKLTAAQVKAAVQITPRPLMQQPPLPRPSAFVTAPPATATAPQPPTQPPASPTPPLSYPH